MINSKSAAFKKPFVPISMSKPEAYKGMKNPLSAYWLPHFSSRHEGCDKNITCNLHPGWTIAAPVKEGTTREMPSQLLPLNLRPHSFMCFQRHHDRQTGPVTFQFVVFRVRGEQDVGEELLKAVAGVPRPVLHVGPHRLVELHQELLRRRAQLLDHLVPLVDVLRFKG